MRSIVSLVAKKRASVAGYDTYNCRWIRAHLKCFAAVEDSDGKRLQSLQRTDTGGRRYLPATPHLTLRAATHSDIPLLQHWDSKDHVKLHSGDPDFNAVEWESELAHDQAVSGTANLIAEVCGVPIGFVAIIDPVRDETAYWGDEYCAGYCANELAAIDVWIGEEDYLNQGYGTAMMRTAIELYCFDKEATKEILIDPMVDNLAAHRFYQRLGFRPENKTHYFGPDHCLVHRLSRNGYFDGVQS